jgi:glycosyltransferase involved in cell wall biosynthesis
MSLPDGVESVAAARVSIAMASYNGERFIEEQLNSLASQTHAPYELVICDDQSTDRTQQIVEAFAARVPFPVRFIRNPDRLYFSSNFMKAAGLCTGDFIAFCDQDDIWDPRKIEVSLKALAQPDVVLCVHDATQVDDAGNVLGLETRKVPKGILPGLDPLMAFSGFTCTFPRGLIELLPADRRPMDVIETAQIVARPLGLLSRVACRLHCQP